ncbi:MAG: leucine-rich repeat protein [Prevotellaceae bacterium]|nr:leucine-rich repeat protein [Prevotellaceae bacterium]
MKKIIRLAAAGCVALLCALPQSCADNEPIGIIGNIEGTVTDYETTQAIPGVMVDIVANASTTFAKQSRQTGNDGKFAFKDLEAGNYKLSFSRSGYLENNQDVNLIAGQTVSSDVRLTPVSFKVHNGMLVEYTGGGGNVVIPDNLGITSIGNNVFKYNTAITSVLIPAGVTSIGQGAFEGCHQLASVDLPNTLTSIGTYAFYNTALHSVVIPNGITTLESFTFYKSPLTSVTVSWRTPINLNNHVFVFGLSIGGGTLRVPTGTKATYQAANYWKNFGTIIEY